PWAVRRVERGAVAVTESGAEIHAGGSHDGCPLAVGYRSPVVAARGSMMVLVEQTSFGCSRSGVISRIRVLGGGQHAQVDEALADRRLPQAVHRFGVGAGATDEAAPRAAAGAGPAVPAGRGVGQVAVVGHDPLLRVVLPSRDASKCPR